MTPYTCRDQIINQDVLKIDLPFFDVCVANLPYQVDELSLCLVLLHKHPMLSADPAEGSRCSRCAKHGADLACVCARFLRPSRTSS
eukprot:2846405-Rhodomonas_salina.1